MLVKRDSHIDTCTVPPGSDGLNPRPSSAPSTLVFGGQVQASRAAVLYVIHLSRTSVL